MRHAPILKFSQRTSQGPCFHLIVAEWGRNRLPREHAHDYHEIFWLVSGTCAHHLNGRKETLETGDVVFLRAEDCHALRPGSAETPFRFINLAVAPEVTNRLKSAYPGQWQSIYERPDGHPLILRASEPDRAALEAELHALAREEQTFFAVERRVLNLWGWALGVFRNRSGLARANTAGPAWLAEALARLDEPEVFSAGVAGFVKAAGRAPEHVARECRRFLQTTPSALVTAARMRHAAHALRMTSRPVLEIALDCGFSGSSQFHRVFKAEHGISPGQWRHDEGASPRRPATGAATAPDDLFCHRPAGLEARSNPPRA